MLGVVMLNVANKLFMLSVIMLSVIVLNVVFVTKWLVMLEVSASPND